MTSKGRLFRRWVITLLLSQLLGCGFGLDPAIDHVGQDLLGQTCQLYVDPQGVPHVRPDPKVKHTSLVGLACLGFAHGRYRAYEMDYLRRTAHGTQAEKVGQHALRLDFFFRLLDFRGRAAKLFDKLDPPTQSALWAYSAGVNKGFGDAFEKDVPYEFKRLGYRPARWEPVDSLSVLFLQSFDQTRKSFQRQLEEREWQEAHGSKAQQLFLEAGLPWDTFILKEGEVPLSKKTALGLPPKPDSAFFREPLARALGQLDTQLSALGLDSGDGSGSNNWVLSGKRTKNALPLLANDPHLKLTRPSFWFWVHLGGGGSEPIGATLPGIPAFLSATTEKLAWGLTNSYLPTARVALVPESDLKNSVQVRPTVWVKWGPLRLPIFWKTFRKTSVSELPVLPIDSPEGKAFVMNWTGFQISPAAVSAVFNLSSANSVEEANQVLSQVDIPSWNFVFADTAGNIGYRAVGRILRLKQTEPFSVPEQTLKEFEESEEFSKPLTAEEMPHLVNPARGYVVSANNRQWSPQGPFEIGNAHTPSFRAFRIEELLKTRMQHDVDSSQKIQCDVQAVDGRFLVPKLLALLKKSNQWSVVPRIAIKALEAWNFDADLNCVACPIFRRWVERIYSEQDLDATSLYRTLVQLEKSQKGLPQILVDPLLEALKELKIADRTPLPLWKDLHRISFHSIAGGEQFETKSSLPTPGDSNSVNPGSSDWADGRFDHHTGASQRLIVELSSPPRVYAMLAGEQMDLEDPEFDKMGNRFQAWAQCELERREYPIPWDLVLKKSEIVHLTE